MTRFPHYKLRNNFAGIHAAKAKNFRSTDS